MAGFDEEGVFFSDAFGNDDTLINQDTRLQIKKRFRDFIRNCHEPLTFAYRYRDQLKQNYNVRDYSLNVDLEDFQLLDAELGEKIRKSPAEFLPLLEEAAKEIADEITRPRPEGDEAVEDIQVTVSSHDEPLGMRELKSEFVSKLVKISGIVIAASGIRVKATNMVIQCRSCRNVVNDIRLKPGLEGYVLPRKCSSDQTGRVPCGLDPYFIVPDKCKCVDYQTLKLQEAPEDVPNGEMPRHLQLYCDRYLCERVAPGNRVTVLGIYSIRKAIKSKKTRDNIAVGIRNPYVRVVGIEVHSEGVGSSINCHFTPQEEEKFRKLAARPDVYEVISNSIAPSIYGSIDTKKSIACLLIGGSRKRLPDGLIRRGDINLLLLGDPGTAKSQLLKFVEKVAPVAVYTSGKGSSAAGLTASVTRDPGTRNFIMEGGAMVLADGGVVCIDEFDKMREDDRVAIHEAMEQQTISIAKAGITTTLNTRCSVLAAANSVYGRWDDSKGDENIDFMPTILSRFDMIYIVKDEHDFRKDTTLARHVIRVHMNAIQPENMPSGELDIEFLKKYIAYVRSRCGPRIGAAAAEKLQNRYVLMRNGSRVHEQETQKRLSIPITVRQLEAIVRISESLAKMSLQPFASESHVDEALRLFQVSTLDAAMSGGLEGAEGFTTTDDIETLNRIEKQIKKRFPIGSQVMAHAIVQDFVKQKYPERAVGKVISAMIRRGELQHRMQRKMLYRIR